MTLHTATVAQLLEWQAAIVNLKQRLVEGAIASAVVALRKIELRKHRREWLQVYCVSESDPLQANARETLLDVEADDGGGAG